MAEKTQKILIKEGSFTITEIKNQFPSNEDGVVIPMKGFNGIKVTGKINNAMVTVTFKVTASVKYPLLADPSTQRIDDTIAFPFWNENGLIIFSIEKQKAGGRCDAEIQFRLLNLVR